MKILLRFGSVGVVATATYAVLALLLETFTALSPVVAHAVAYGMAIPVSFYGQRTWTFRHKGRVSAAFWRFLLTNAVALALTSTVVAQVDRLGWPSGIGTGFTVLAVPAISFAMMKIWVFPGEGPVEGGGRRDR
jgi:putative flippase GtrA